MCSIFGIIGDFPASSVQKAFDRLSHRGPDDSARISAKHHWFGVHRLAIESAGSTITQPLDTGETILLFNGEIYNYRELAAILGVPGADEPRTLLAAWKQWGSDAVSQFRGMYALAIFDKNSNTLHLFRDPAGKKPLYWLQTDHFFAFASEAKALYTFKPLSPERRHLVQYLGYQSTIAPHTLDRDIRKLEPGERLEIRLPSREGGLIGSGSTQNALSASVYDPWLQIPILHHDRKRSMEAVEKALDEAVAIRIPRKVEWGILLSGGLDSSLLTALATRKNEKPIQTFSIGYQGYTKYDERPWARMTAKHLKTEHREFLFGKREFFETLERLLPLLDEPLGDPAAIPLFFLMQQVAEEGIRVLLGGEGSDELFLGYWTYRRFFDYDSLPYLPDAPWLGSYLRSHYSSGREWEWYKRLSEGEVLFRSSAELYTDLQLSRLFRFNIRDGQNYEAISRYRQRYEASSRNHPADWYSYIDLKIMLAEVYLHKQDRISMAAGIEARSPFMDRQVIETAFAIDPALRMETAPKGLLRDIASKFLSSEIVHRKKKGFNYPFIEWILEDGGIETIMRSAKKSGLFRMEHLAFLSERADRGKFRQHLFPLYLLARWLEYNPCHI